MIPALLAEAEATGALTRDVVASLAVAYEVTARVAHAFPSEPLRVHPHGAFAPLGAAAGVRAKDPKVDPNPVVSQADIDALAGSSRPMVLLAIGGIGLILILVGGTLGTVFAGHPTQSLLNLLRFSVAAAGPVLIVWAWRPDVATARRYARFWVAGALISGIVGLVSPGDASGRTAGLAGHPNPLAIISSPAGIAISAVTPVTAVGSSRTEMACRRAKRLTTKSPSMVVGATSSRSREISRAFSSASRSGLMPIPLSTMRTRQPA